MKNANIIIKIVAALAAVAGVVFVIAGVSDQVKDRRLEKRKNLLVM